MIYEITFQYTILLSIWLIILSFRVLDLRGSPVTKFLHPKDRVVNPETLKRAIRGHGNLTEYAPMFLILLFFCEQNQISKMVLHTAAAIFTLGRFIHGYGFCFTSGILGLRIGGMALTFTGFFMLLSRAIALFL